MSAQKIRMAKAVVIREMGKPVAVERIEVEAPRHGEVTMRVVANHSQKAALAMFSREIAPAGTSWSPGTTGPGGGRPAVSPLIKPFSFLLDKADVQMGFELDGEFRPVSMAPVPDAAEEPAIELPAAFSLGNTRFVRKNLSSSSRGSDVGISCSGNRIPGSESSRFHYPS